MTRALTIVIAIGLVQLPACDKKDASPAPASVPPAAISEPEVTQALDACSDYRARACACRSSGSAAPTANDDCAQATPLVEAITLASRVARNANASRLDANQAAGNIRKLLKRCIEETAGLAERGCR